MYSTSTLKSATFLKFRIEFEEMESKKIFRIDKNMLLKFFRSTIFTRLKCLLFTEKPYLCGVSVGELKHLSYCHISA